MILYIHGFGSSGCGGKASIFKEEFKEGFIAPSLSYVPNLAIDTLSQIIEYTQKKGEEVFLIGSSLGGYYSLYLSNKYNLKAVLINPSIYPYKLLGHMGMGKNYYDDSQFLVTNEHIQSLKKFEVDDTTNNEKNIMLLLQKADDVCDYKEALKKLPNAVLHLEEGGSHSFENIERYFQTIRMFFN